MAEPKPSVASRWSWVTFACPPALVLVGRAAGRGVANEEVAMRVIGLAALGFLLLALVALIAAFNRKERLRWFALLPLRAIFAMLTLGVSSRN